jgi:hypothetical protein
LGFLVLSRANKQTKNVSFKQIRGKVSAVELKIKKTITSIRLAVLGGINVCLHPLLQ